MLVASLLNNSQQADAYVHAMLDSNVVMFAHIRYETGIVYFSSNSG
jgi:hypothetical protein